MGARGIYGSPDPDDPEKVLSGKICTPDRDETFRDETFRDESVRNTSLLEDSILHTQSL